MSRFAFAAAVLAVGFGWSAGRADEPTTEQLVKDFLQLNKEMVELLDGVKDKEGAEAAKPKLEKVGEALAKTVAALEKKPKADVEDAFKAAGGFPKDWYGNAYERLAWRVQIAPRILGNNPAIKKVSDAKDDLARITTVNFEKAAKAYWLKFNEYPPTLFALLKPPMGASPFIEGDEKILIDPWGSPYRYDVQPDETGMVRVYVWTERTVDGRTKVIGGKPPEKKEK